MKQAGGVRQRRGQASCGRGEQAMQSKQVALLVGAADAGQLWQGRGTYWVQSAGEAAGWESAAEKQAELAAQSPNRRLNSPGS